ncbi:MAG: polysaccharide biosynthesis/export family protein [Elusimicrobia bacterium]|nr:polysaccharide biosynthesis/export family protein [Elusimicrobiota bacterium]
MKRTLRLAIVFAVVWSGLPARPMAAWAQAEAQALQQIKEAESNIPVGPGDVVSIGVFPVQEYSREVTVQPDGKVELPLIGALQIKGMNSRDIQTLLEAKYARFVANPKITVNIRRYSGRRVAIIGQISSPGYYEFRDGMKLLELVSLAGGPRDLAKPSKTVLLRQAGGRPQALDVNLAAVLRGEFDRNLELMPGDTVVIPKAAYTKSAEWMAINVLPWLALSASLATLVVLAK